MQRRVRGGNSTMWNRPLLILTGSGISSTVSGFQPPPKSDNRSPLDVNRWAVNPTATVNVGSGLLA